jgi:hypothetical protein
MDSGVEELLRGFRIEVADQVGGVLDVTEHHRHLFAFTLQGTARGENLLG